ncbi:MAG: WecB/TagA/CpsF family glycosyltransferase [Peptococcaceae bacterium]|nr:WecB/TagA/CpsF family glycosyltransferase [Peptococcaceae bacterium]
MISGQPQVKVLGVGIDGVTMEESVRFIRGALEEGRRLRVVTANPEMILRAESDEGLREILSQADFVVPDGEGVVWAARVLGSRLPERVTGIDLARRLLEEGATYGWRVFFVGGKPGVADEAAVRVRREFPGLMVGTHHGYFAADEEDEADVLALIREFRPDILLAGMGVPFQEVWLSKYPDLAGVRVGVGGTFDVFAGRAKRAPGWVQRLRLEWLFRLLREPKRFRRQLVLPRYMWRVIRQRVFGP